MLFDHVIAALRRRLDAESDPDRAQARWMHHPTPVTESTATFELRCRRGSSIAGAAQRVPICCML